MEFKGKIISIDRELSDLDVFTLEFLRILKKHVSYVIISGYVSILLGRARSSEDVDILIPKMSHEKFNLLFKDLENSGFYCINGENMDEMYSYMVDKLAIRFAKLNTVIPNIELKFAKNKIDDITLSNTLTVFIGKEKLIISGLEMQIAFKEKILKSGKDLEDARHIRNIAEGHLDKTLLKKYERMLDEFYR